jgi:uncharacterized protein DUF4242
MNPLKFLLIFIIAVAFANCTNNTKTTAETLRAAMTTKNTTQNMYVIEREITELGDFTTEQLKGASQTSYGVLEEMGSEIKWLHSYVTNDKMYCVYLAPNEEMVLEHAKKGGFPANSVSKVSTVIDPSTAK